MLNSVHQARAFALPLLCDGLMKTCAHGLISNISGSFVGQDEKMKYFTEDAKKMDDAKGETSIRGTTGMVACLDSVKIRCGRSIIPLSLFLR